MFGGQPLQGLQRVGDNQKIGILIGGSCFGYFVHDKVAYPFLVKVRDIFMSVVTFCFQGKNRVSSGKHNDRLSVKIQSMVAGVFPLRSAPRMEVISSIVLDITLFPFEHLSTVIFF